VPRPLTAQQLRATHEPVRRQIDALLDEYTDAQVARILNDQGMCAGVSDSLVSELSRAESSILFLLPLLPIADRTSRLPRRLIGLQGPGEEHPLPAKQHRQ
jgi:hypothetical protein